MLTIELLGALLLHVGLVYMAWTAINRGRMSDPAVTPNDAGKRTLEPRHRGLGFLGWRANWPGLVQGEVLELELESTLRTHFALREQRRLCDVPARVPGT